MTRNNLEESVNTIQYFNMANFKVVYISDLARVQLSYDYFSISQIYSLYGERAAETRLLDLKWTRRQDLLYTEKLLHFAVNDLIITKCTDGNGYMLLPGDFLEALKVCVADISVISVIARHADVCTVDHTRKNLVDYLLDSLLYRYQYWEFDHTPTGWVDNRRLRPMHEVNIEDETVFKLFTSLLNARVLNERYKWGHSYFGVFVMVRWWKLVEWGLNSGANVSVNRMYPNIPLDALFVHNSSRLPDIHTQLFSRLLHPSNVNRAIPVHVGDTPVVPLVAIGIKEHRTEFCLALLEAGACIVVPNRNGQLPMDVYVEKMFSMDPYLFNHMIPRSQGVSPTLFLKLLLTCISQDTFHKRNMKPLILAVFAQRLMLSSRWNELEIATYSKTYLSKDNTHPNKTIFVKRSDLQWVPFILDLLTKCGIRPRSVTQFKSLPNTNDRHLHRAQEKWNEYRTFVPSLFIQSVRAIRSSMQLVTQDRLNELPLPKAMKEMISLETIMENVYDELRSKLYSLDSDQMMQYP